MKPVQFFPFASWDDVIAHVKDHRSVYYYHAPLDYRPSLVQCSANVSKRTIKLTPLTRDCDPFTATESHLSRFVHLELGS